MLFGAYARNTMHRKKDQDLVRLREIAAEFTDHTRPVEAAVNPTEQELQISFDNGYSFVIGRQGQARIEPF